MKAAENGAFARVFIFRTDDGRLGAVAVLPISALIGDGGRVGTGGDGGAKRHESLHFIPAGSGGHWFDKTLSGTGQCGQNQFVARYSDWPKMGTNPVVVEAVSQQIVTVKPDSGKTVHFALDRSGLTP